MRTSVLGPASDRSSRAAAVMDFKLISSGPNDVGSHDCSSYGAAFLVVLSQLGTGQQIDPPLGQLSQHR